MALSRQKYKRVPDLYIVGTEHKLRDGTMVWLQVLNPLQRDEAQHDAQVARGRLILALKSEHGSDERTKVEAAFFEDGRNGAVQRLVNANLANHLVKTVESIKTDPDWKERLEIMDRSDELMARPPEDAERKLLVDINRDYIDEVTRRQNEEEGYLEQRFRAYTDEQLIDEYIELYVTRRGSDVASAEFMLTEIWYAARVCEGKEIGPGEYDHSDCENHVLQAYETKAEVRALPEDLQQELATIMSTLNMTVFEAKNSARQGSSSGSSPLPSEPEGSTPSIPAATPANRHGSSPQLSGTR